MQLTPGSLINVGVLYRTPKLLSLRDLASYLQSTPDAIRHLAPISLPAAVPESHRDAAAGERDRG